MEWQWNMDAFDAVHISLPNAEIQVVGTDASQVFLESDENKRYARGEPDIQGRWLVIHPAYGSGDWTLELPKSKAWTIEIAAASGEVEINNVHARLQVQLGSGEINVRDCRGEFQLRSGSGDIEIENCLQTETPPAPPFMSQEPAPADDYIPPLPSLPSLSHIGKLIRPDKFVDFQNNDEWEQYGEQWEAWGERFAEQASRWAEKFSREFGGNLDWQEAAREPGLYVWLGSGDAQFERVDAARVSVKLGNGDVDLEDGRIGELVVETSRGDTQIENILPVANWDITTRHGDIQLTLPDDTNARLDVATRHGDIESDVPLVGVGRPGRAARHGGRMVGTLGAVSDTLSEIHLESLHGDIQIDMTGHNSRYAGQSAKARAYSSDMPKPPPAPPAPDAPDIPLPDVQTTDANAPEPSYNSQLAILQALQRSEITVAEAEALLHTLKN